MGYADNPRNIYGKVVIAYAESDISRDIETAVSGNSTISHPREVAGSALAPTVKACTMDGHSTMDGTFQMLDDTCILGWWSGGLSSSTGRFINDTFIELTFLSRPVNSWVLVGDSKLGQYPVNFTVIFKKGSEVIATRSYENNTSMRVNIEVDFTEVTAIRLQITKWSTPYACAKILQFYDSFEESYYASDLQSFEIIEEMCAQDGGYNLSSDTASLILYNKDRKFDRGYLKELMIPDRKVKFYLGDDEDELTLAGIFYSDEWKADQDSQWIKCSCVDKLYQMQNKQYMGFAMKENATLYEIAVDIATAAGFKAGEYGISSALQTIVIPKAYLSKQSVWNALQEVAYTGLARVYIDRNNHLVVRSDMDDPTESDIEINKGNMFSYSSTISQTCFANRISVEYSDVTLSEEMVEAATTEIRLGRESYIDITLNFTKEITDAVAECSNPLLTLTRFTAGVNACSLRVTNPYTVDLSGTITVSGKEISSTKKTITVEDASSISASGASEYTHPSSSLIQTSSLAEAIGRFLLEQKKAGEGVVTVDWRGNLNLALGCGYVNKDRFDDSKNLLCQYNKFTFDGGLRQQTRGKKIVGG